MATFECKVYELRIEEHPNADVLELAIVGDYRSIVRKGQFKTGDLGVYIPEAAIVPEWLIEELGLTGRLAGKQKNRVKAVKLRGILSQGLIVPILTKSFMGVSYPAVVTPTMSVHVEVGRDVTDLLGIIKYEPPIPSSMSGEVWNAFGMTITYDIENIKKYPHIIVEGEDQVIFTEKLHGTWCCFGYHPDIDIPIITSKGLSGRGLAFKINEANKTNLYVQTFESLKTEGVNILEDFLTEQGVGGDWKEKGNQPFYILGEIFGKGVQDLAYGTEEKLFRIFDIYVGEPGKGMYMDTFEVEQIVAKMHNVEYVPILYKGMFSKVEMEKYTDGRETISGKEACIREGIVVRLQNERRNDEIGRVILKSVSEKYLLRRNATEFN